MILLLSMQTMCFAEGERELICLVNITRSCATILVVLGAGITVTCFINSNEAQFGSGTHSPLSST